MYNKKCLSIMTLACIIFIVIISSLRYKSNRSEVKETGYGYILGTHFNDQLTASTVNLFSLQCWAASLHDKVRVVEPLTCERSVLGFEESFLRNVTSVNEYPKLYDYFDEETWSSQTKKWNFSPLVPWDVFMSKAPRRIIIAGHYCDDIVWDKMFLAPTKFAEDNGFEILKKICTNKDKLLSAQKYREMIYGEHKPNETVVLFIRWGGISGWESPMEFQFREVISGLKKCERGNIYDNNIFVLESQRIIENGRNYINKYLSADVGYIGVMMRFEQFFMRHGLNNESARISNGRACISSILNKVATIKNERGITKVFLAMDTGKYGTSAFQYGVFSSNTSSDDILSAMLFNELFSNGSLSYEDWEESFHRTADFRMSGYIAMLQQNVAANAKVLLLAGGGTFQELAKSMHERFHPFKHDCHQLCE